MYRLSASQTEAYLRRIAFTAALQPSLATLNALHQSHMLHVPFENLDIALGRGVSLDADVVLDKIIQQKRGGFCYELNGAFALLLRSLGFEVTYLAARVYQGEALGPPFDHMLLAVKLGDQYYLADVGFGDSFREVMQLGQPAVEQCGAEYKIRSTANEQWVLWQNKLQWQAQYIFDLQAYPLAAFSDCCHYHQTSPASSFTRKSVCSMATISGRKTISNGRYIEHSAAGKSEQIVVDEMVYRGLLREHFSLSLPNNVDVSKLLYQEET